MRCQIAQEGENSDLFVKALYKNYRKHDKKLDRIKDLEKRPSLNEDQADTVSKKGELEQAVREIDTIFTLYKKSVGGKQEETKEEDVKEVKEEPKEEPKEEEPKEETITVKEHEKLLAKAVKAAQNDSRKRT
jgi:hypothetical protein